MEIRVRPSSIAGQWYPGDAAQLRRSIEGLIRSQDPAPLRIDGQLVGLIVPHAGYAYSGGVAAHAYAQLGRRSYHRVVLLGPSHWIPIAGVAASRFTHYQTPLGEVPLDQPWLGELAARYPLLELEESREHSLEIQLPFLQALLGEFQLVPLLVGEVSVASTHRLAEALAERMRVGGTLLVGSTDLSHYCPDPVARRLDRTTLDRIEALDAEGLAADLAAGRCEACGRYALLATLLTAQRLGADRATILKYATSGELTGEFEQVVGYAAMALWSAADRTDSR